MKSPFWNLCLGLGVLAGAVVSGPAAGQERINCANEFRSGKLYFSQAQQQKDMEEKDSLYQKSVERFEVAVETCPEKWDYHLEYARSLSEYAGFRLENLIIAPPADSAAIWDRIFDLEDLYRKAGRAFQQAWDLEDRKSARKKVRETREHYWVERYNHGLKLLKEDRFDYADVGLRWARHVDPTRAKAYSQGAIALISLGKKAEAAELVQAGLEQEPEDKALNDLQEKIFIDAADQLTREAEELARQADDLARQAGEDPAKEAEAAETAGKAAAKSVEAIGYIETVLEKRPDDPNLLFKRAVANQARAIAITEGETPGPEELSRKAADDFARAAAKVPYAEDAGFHLACLFNKIQAHIKANDCDAAIETIKAYIALDHKDPAVWQSWAICLSQMDRPDAAVSALMLSKSLAGQDVEVASAVDAAREDAADAVKSMGKPDFIRTYQEASSGNQIESWFWIDKRTAMSFILGVKNGEMTW